jgi:fatty acid-binding protein DegV
MIKIVTDSTADIPPELESDITVVPCYIEFGETSYRDGLDLTREQFYARLATTGVMPKTAAPDRKSVV